jgi:hypothetical protein
MFIKRGKFASKMIVQFKPSQDAILLLSQEELDGLEAKMHNTDFFGNCLKATSKEAEAHFFVGSSIDKIFENVKEEGGVQYKLPQELGDPYLINLKQTALTLLQRYKEYGIRYFGGAKLQFVVKERLK